MAEERILPPFPDVIVTGGSKADAIEFLVGLELPSRIAQTHLTRWGSHTGVPISKVDLRRVMFRRRDLP